MRVDISYTSILYIFQCFGILRICMHALIVPVIFPTASPERDFVAQFD